MKANNVKYEVKLNKPQSETVEIITKKCHEDKIISKERDIHREVVHGIDL